MSSPNTSSSESSPSDEPTASVYTSDWLRAGAEQNARYDRRVFGVTCRWWGWGPTAAKLVDFYRTNLRERHLDVGVGTGYLLDHADLPPSRLRALTLLDINAEPLAVTAERLSRYSPTTVRADVRDTWDVADNSMTSVGSSFMLHCVPDPQGTGMAAKVPQMFDEAARVLVPGGRFFGNTIIDRNWVWAIWTPVGAYLQRQYRNLGWFDNRHDTAEGIRTHLESRFTNVRVWVQGRTAFWTADAPGGEGK